MIWDIGIKVVWVKVVWVKVVRVKVVRVKVMKMQQKNAFLKYFLKKIQKSCTRKVAQEKLHNEINSRPKIPQSPLPKIVYYAHTLMR